MLLEIAQNGDMTGNFNFFILLFNLKNLLQEACLNYDIMYIYFIFVCLCEYVCVAVSKQKMFVMYDLLNNFKCI